MYDVYFGKLYKGKVCKSFENKEDALDFHRDLIESGTYDWSYIVYEHKVFRLWCIGCVCEYPRV